MESEEPEESNSLNEQSGGGRLLGPKSQSFVFFSILCVLLKSEALFTFFVYWLRGLQLTSGTIGLPDHNTLSHLWLLKPFFSLLIDKMDVPISQDSEEREKERSTREGEKKKQSERRRPLLRYNSLSFFPNVKNYRVVVLLVAEYLIAFASVTLYVLHMFKCFHTFFTNLLVYVQGLSLVCASSYAEGLFCRYVKSKPEETYVKFVSLRLAMTSLYGFTTMACILLPVFFQERPLGKFFQINVFFPLFLTFNAVFVSWVVSRPVAKDEEEGSESRYGIEVKEYKKSPGSEGGVGGDERESQVFSVESMVSLLALLLVSMRLKNDFFNKHTHTRVDNYMFVLLSQLFKFVVSVMMIKFMGTKNLKRSCLLVFGTTILLLYPFKTNTSTFFERMASLGRWEVVLVGLALSLVQQVLITYSLMKCLHMAPKGYEASIMSLPSFTAHATHLCLRQHVIDYLDLSHKQKSIFQYFSFALFCYFLFVIYKDTQELKKRGKSV
ncbi:conserved hypothetical protein [Theileria orientalis strain Shintoku]|uniref:Uncharacterized protein n=1 Tax=Theileria orientalis strain Shintoku TaxID=869250 RepID=J4C417_THEOR|nr:conserved hypothetical protein [Theileria orientalis strain Shintoku]BAM41406.1 conserved hypothetical protein [Theileria orientalis strain Shintoku]|eukprot:XP_009691707.1 conserved hypothetical protein [Theileria orientalis strain Shintoku]